VSPSWHESIRLGLCPDRVVFAVYGRGLRPAVLEKGTVPVKPHGQEPWRAPLAALPDVLKEHAPRTTEATLVVSNHFVRYLLLDANPDLSGRREWREYAMHRFEKTYGAKAVSWDVEVAETRSPLPRIASAVDRALIEGVIAAFNGSRARLVSIEPYLATAFNRVPAAMTGSSFWFVLQEPGRVLLALIREGVWQCVRGRRAGARWHEDLARMVERERALLRRTELCREILVSAIGAEQPAAMDALNLTLLPSGLAAGERAFAMVCG